MKQRGRVAARSDYLIRCVTRMDTCQFCASRELSNTSTGAALQPLFRQNPRQMAFYDKTIQLPANAATQLIPSNTHRLIARIGGLHVLPTR